MSEYNKRIDFTLGFTRKIPEYIKTNYPKFVTFIETYYKYLIDNDYIKLEDIRDIDKTHDFFLNQYKEEFSRFFPIHEIDDNKNEILKHLREFYLSRGSEKSFNVLFSVLYNTIPSFRYPYNNVFTPSASKWQQEQFIEVQRYSGNFPDEISKIRIDQADGIKTIIPVTKHELLTNNNVIFSSEDLSDTSVWSYATNTLVESNNTEDPFGKITGDLIYNNSSVNANPLIYQTFKTGKYTKYYVSAYVKKDTTNFWYIQVKDNATTDYINVFMNTSLVGTGLLTTSRSGTKISIDSSKFLMTSEGNNWYRASFPITVPKNITARLSIGVMSRYPLTSTSTNPGEGSYVWGVCVEPGTIKSEYKKGRARLFFKPDPSLNLSEDIPVRIYNTNNTEVSVGKLQSCPSKVIIYKDSTGKVWSGSNYVVGQIIKIPGTEKDTLVRVTSVNPLNGAIKTLSVIEFGYNHSDDPVVIYPNQNKESITQARLIIDKVSQYSGFTYGTWLNNKSNVSDRLCYLQDNNFFQRMSYQLSSEINPNEYINIVNEINHPAGKKAFYNYEITQEYKSNFGISIDEISSVSKNLNPQISSSITFHENEITSSGVNRYERGDYFASREDLNIQNHYCEISSTITINISEGS